MKKDDIAAILQIYCHKERENLDPPSTEDWMNLEDIFNCRFSSEFRCFIELQAEYAFPGEFLNVSTGRTNGNDGILFTYEYELKHGEWIEGLIPFYSIGNGDYFCLKAQEGPDSPVYYYDHEDRRVEMYSINFREWIEGLHDFLL